MSERGRKPLPGLRYGIDGDDALPRKHAVRTVEYYYSGW